MKYLITGSMLTRDGRVVEDEPICGEIVEANCIAEVLKKTYEFESFERRMKENFNVELTELRIKKVD